MGRLNYEVYKSPDGKLVGSVMSTTITGIVLDTIHQSHREARHTLITKGSFEVGDYFGSEFSIFCTRRFYWYIENANEIRVFDPKGLERFLEIPQA